MHQSNEWFVEVYNCKAVLLLYALFPNHTPAYKYVCCICVENDLRKIQSKLAETKMKPGTKIRVSLGKLQG